MMRKYHHTTGSGCSTTLETQNKKQKKEKQRITMVEFKWIKTTLFLIALLQLTAAAEKLYLTVRDGDEVTFPCKNVTDDQQNCDYTTWIFSDASSSTTVELIDLGQFGKRAKSKSGRLSVTANCSLVMKKVTAEDAGRYTCRQFRSGKQQGEDSRVYLSVISLNEQKDDDMVTLNCSVSSYDQYCRHTVKLLYEDKDLKTSQTDCSTTVSFLTSYYIYTSRLNLLKCEVADGNTGIVLFPVRLQSGKKIFLIFVCFMDLMFLYNITTDGSHTTVLY
ncbi:hypothetical protein L3Q82_012785 [Scortum barcoo]|uniref:Uncharacterized protein n=1 Tax=Scortum barcoo TaxID=214431 RepID=A0ACB8W3C7_9TELE|nr:hypothetical protein L3Q82_012785 [Scortum barcoo]